jgi:hypothetical protein
VTAARDYIARMNHGPTQWLLVSAALEIIAACLLGFVMLVPMQPWASSLRARWPSTKALMSVHLDMVMLALMQIAAGLGMRAIPGPHDRVAALLLVASGWSNVAPYAWRLVGVNAFALGGGALQRFAALTSGAGTIALTAGWVALLLGWI